MRDFKRVAVVLTVCIVSLIVLGFVIENQERITLSFLGWSTPELPTSVLMILSLLFGLFIGPLVGGLFKCRVIHK